MVNSEVMVDGRAARDLSDLGEDAVGGAGVDELHFADEAALRLALDELHVTALERFDCLRGYRPLQSRCAGCPRHGAQ